MVCILTNENVSKQLWGGDAFVNDLLGCSRLMNDVTLTAYPFWIAVSRNIQLLRDESKFVLFILPNALHLTAAVTDGGEWFMNQSFNLKVVRNNRVFSTLCFFRRISG